LDCLVLSHICLKRKLIVNVLQDQCVRTSFTNERQLDRKAVRRLLFVMQQCSRNGAKSGINENVWYLHYARPHATSLLITSAALIAPLRLRGKEARLMHFRSPRVFFHRRARDTKRIQH